MLTRTLGTFFARLFPSLSRNRYLSPDVEALASTLFGKEFNYARFEQTIGYKPRNWNLFFESLLHRSYLQYVDNKLKSNERLEFLGDAVLNCLVAEYLYTSYPAMEEGDLTKIRSRLVNRKTLAQRAKDIQLSDFMLLSASAVQSIDSGSESILSDAFEAVIGAIYLDGGIDSARKFVHRTLISNAVVFNSALTDDNYKSALLEYSQARSLGVPRYTVLKEDGPDHDRRWTGSRSPLYGRSVSWLRKFWCRRWSQQERCRASCCRPSVRKNQYCGCAGSNKWSQRHTMK
ncbi:MAG: ribonuclease III [Ignavibacteriales bacterium]|nr:ribonuclease III [Ignavibacteriales bacterium]